MKSPLSAVGSYQVFYAAEDRDTVPRETGAIIVDPISGTPISTARPPAIDLTIDVVLQQVVDLTDSAVCEELSILPGDLLVKWRELVGRNQEVPTHIIGRAARATGVEALIVPSVQLLGTKNIAILVGNLKLGSSIEIHRPDGFPAGTQVRIEGTV